MSKHPCRHTTSFQRWYDVVRCRMTSSRSWNDVCLQGSTLSTRQNVILFYNYVVKFSKCCHTIMNNPHLTFLAKLMQRWYNLFNIEKRNLMLRFQRCINVSWGGNVAMTLNIWRRSIDVVKTSWNWPRDFNVPATLWAQHPYYVMSSTYLPTLRQRRNNVVLLTL